ncbi:MAG: hypothetical protein IJX47_02045 [Clostridia bacterium]|nr:hypothetical protein [Clostridia bacterium]
MKKLLATILAASTVLCMAPAFAVSAAEAPAITLDGDVSEWEGLDTIVTTLDSGAKYTYYGVVNEEGLYVAVDAYTTGFDASAEGDWWNSPNLEFFVGPYTGDQNQRWVSCTNKEGGWRKEGNVTDAAVTYEAVEGDVSNHFVIEAYIARAQLEDGWFYADGSIRVGMAVDTNNSPDGKGAYITPAGTHERNNRTLVTSTGVYACSETGNISATYYKAPTVDYPATIGEDSYEARCSFDGNEKFDATIETLINGSLLMSEEKVTSVSVTNNFGNWYIFKWTGTMTAKEAGEYTLIGRKIDNGFTMFVDGVKVYEYWGASHWFDGADDRLVSNDAKFTLAANETVDVEIYFLELGGGDALEIYATTTPDDTNSGKNINEAFTFDLTKQHYSTDKGKWANDLVGRGTGGNGSQCIEENFKFDSSINKLLEAMVKGDTKNVATLEAALISEDGYVVEYSGWLVPEVTGEYTFGAYDVDNGFMMEIGGERVYEMWAGYSWNDGEQDGRAHGNTYTETVTLEAGKAYPFKAYFLETDGGQVLNMNCSVDGGDKMSLNHAFVFYAEDPTATPDTNPGTDTPAKTGDAMVYSVVAAVAVLSLGAVVVSKKRRIAE